MTVASAGSVSDSMFVSRYVRTGTAVVVKGVVGDWPALRRWTPGYLADFTAAMGDIDVPYRSTPAGLPQVDMQRIERGTTSLLNVLQECARSPRDGPEVYVPGMDLPAATPLAGDIGRPEILSSVDIYATSVFLGRNTRCIGHFHPRSQALLCQVQGVKQVRMFSPEALGRLDLFPVWSDGFFRSRFNFYGDPADHPPFALAEGQVVELHPGDAIFLPMHWLHVPEGAGWNVSVTHWWRPDRQDWRISAASLRSAVGIGFEMARQRRDGRRAEGPPGES